MKCQIKKILTFLIIFAMSFAVISCTHDTVTAANTLNVKNEDSKIKSKVKDICNKDTIKSLLKGKKINEGLKEVWENFSDKELAIINGSLKDLGLSIDEKVFNSEEETYDFISDSLFDGVKEGVKKGFINNETLKQMRFLSFIGIKIPNIDISKDMSDEDIETLCFLYLDIADKFTEPAVLKIFGIDVKDPNAINDLKKVLFNGSV